MHTTSLPITYYDIRPKLKVWAGSPNECRTFSRTLYSRMRGLYCWVHWATRKCIK